MKVLKAGKDGIAQAIKIIKAGGVVVYPTDTAYALGGIFNLAKVNKKILLIKKRRDKKFTLIAASINQVKNFFNFSGPQIKLAKKYWPGPLSIVVSLRFAVRVPKNKISQTLAQRVGRPLIATSANVSGKRTSYSIQDVLKDFSKQKYQPDFILDAGKLVKKKASTIVKVKNGKVKVLRQGQVKIKAL